MSVEVCECGHPRIDHGSIESDDFAGECFEGEEDWWCACLRYTPAASAATAACCTMRRRTADMRRKQRARELRLAGTGIVVPTEPRRAPQTARDELGGGSETHIALRASTGQISAVPLAVLAAMSERAFQAHVRTGLEARGWLVFAIPDMRRTRAGWPDLIAVHPTYAPGGHASLLAWELKTEKGRVRPDQERVLQALARIDGIDVRVVRPQDWAWISRVMDAERCGGSKEHER